MPIPIEIAADYSNNLPFGNMPFVIGSKIYVVGLNGSSSPGVFSSADNGNTWTHQDAAHEPSPSGLITCDTDGTFIYFVSVNASNFITIWVFDTTTNLWGANYVSTRASSADTEIVCSYRSGDTALVIMGQFFATPGNEGRCGTGIFDTSTLTFGTFAQTAGSTSDDNTTWAPVGIVVVNNITPTSLLMYLQGPTTSGGSTSNLVVNEFTTSAGSTVAIDASSTTNGIPETATPRAGNGWIIVAWQPDATNDPTTVHVLKAPLSTPTTFALQVLTPGNFPVFSVSIDDNGTLELLMSYGNSPYPLYQFQDSGSGFGSGLELLPNVSINDNSDQLSSTVSSASPGWGVAYVDDTPALWWLGSAPSKASLAMPYGGQQPFVTIAPSSCEIARQKVRTHSGSRIITNLGQQVFPSLKVR
jgi:hypothetical protein